MQERRAAAVPVSVDNKNRSWEQNVHTLYTYVRTVRSTHL